MALKRPNDTDEAFFTLSAWCTATRQWIEHPVRFRSVQHAEQAAAERGIYRVTATCNRRKIFLEPFAIVGDS
jgi:hypothetical protein